MTTTSLDELNEDFRDLLAAFAEEEVEFVIVGAYALAFHGAPRASGDIDLLVRPTAENATRVVRALRRFGAPIDAHGVTQADFERAGSVYQVGLPPRRIDVLTELTGVPFDEVWATRVAAQVEGREVAVIGRETYVRNKRALGRPKDLADIERLDR